MKNVLLALAATVAMTSSAAAFDYDQVKGAGYADAVLSCAAAKALPARQLANIELAVQYIWTAENIAEGGKAADAWQAGADVLYDSIAAEGEATACIAGVLILSVKLTGAK